MNDLAINPFVSTQNHLKIVPHTKFDPFKDSIDFLKVPYDNSTFQPELKLYQKLSLIPFFNVKSHVLGRSLGTCLFP